MTRRPHVLLLGMQFPPARGSGVYRIRGWANHLVRRGFDVTVLAADRAYWDDLAGVVDDELATTIDPRVRVEHVHIPHEHLQQDLRRMSWLHASFPRLYTKAHARLRQAIFPEVYAPLLPVFVAHGLRVHARHRVDLVLASGNPFTQYGAAYRLGRLLRRPFVVDYHDPWTLDLWKEADAFPPGHPAHTWERRIVEHACLVVTVNAPLVQWYRDRYPSVADRVRLVPNGIAEELVRQGQWRPRPPDEPLRYTFLGTIRADLPLAEFLDGWDLALKEPELRGATMGFHGYLGFFRQQAEVIRSRIESGAEGVSYRGAVSQTRIAEVFAESDVMAMLLTSSRYVTAGKGYDYMASGLPVVGVHDPRNHTREVFADYPLFFGVDAVTPDAIRDALVAAARAARAQTPGQHAAGQREALRHTWDRNMDAVGAEIGALARG
jgi:hypothetical protein